MPRPTDENVFRRTGDAALMNVLREPTRACIIAEDAPRPKTKDDLPRTMEVFINPNRVKVKGRANWPRIAVPGLSHEVMQYSHTNSRELNFTLQWSAIESLRRNKRSRLSDDPDRPGTINIVNQYRHFLYSFLQPMQPGFPPSRVRIVWPDFLHLVGVITDLDFTVTKFASSGSPMAFDCDVDFVELRTTFLQRNERTDFFKTADTDGRKSQEPAEQTNSPFSADLLPFGSGGVGSTTGGTSGTGAL